MTVAWSKVSQRLRFTPQQHIRASAQSKSSFGNATTKRQNKQPRGQKFKTKASWRSSLSLPTTRWTTRQKTLRTSPRLLQILSTIQIVTKLWLCPSRSKSSNHWIVVALEMLWIRVIQLALMVSDLSVATASTQYQVLLTCKERI